MTWRRPIWLFMFCPTCLNALRQNQLNKATFCHFTLVSYAIFYKCKIQWIFETAIFLASVVEAFSKSDQENKFSFGGLKCFASVEDIIETYKVIVFAFADSEKLKIPQVKGEAHRTSTSILTIQSRCEKTLQIQHHWVYFQAKMTHFRPQSWSHWGLCVRS